MTNTEILNHVEKNWLKKYTKIKFLGLNRKLPKKLETFYRNLYPYYFCKYPTIKADSVFKIEPQNYYEKITECFTSKDKKRSLIDQFLLCNYYYNCSLIEFLKVVENNQPLAYRCPTIGRCILGTEKTTPTFVVYAWLMDRKCGEFASRTFKEFMDLLN